MNELLLLAGAIASLLGAVFFLAGALGLLRLPDLYTRIHAPTKAATLGLMFMALGSSLVHFRFGQSAWLEDLLLIVVVFLTVPVGSQVLIRGAAARRVSQDARTQGEPPRRE
jgi:monovalent cation/proton antiporter MnhG/PhaG subunit